MNAKRLLFLSLVVNAVLLGTLVHYRMRPVDITVEDLAPPMSFSEVENAGDTLDALARQFLTQVRAGHSVRTRAYCKHIPGAIQELEEGIEQFNETPQQAMLVRELLWLLKREKQYDRWIDLYLSELYRHPRRETVGVLAEEAVALAQDVGRAPEVLAAFRHLCDIPQDFDSKRQVAVALIRHGSSRLAQHVPATAGQALADRPGFD
ncbi:MAG: hypothetical protein AB1705_00820 [Verrucomicrobiota bacterium]